MTDKNGGHAEIWEDDNGLIRRSDMTLRDWFAGQALAGYLANSRTPHQSAKDCAGYIYEMADAMLEARK